MLIYKVIIKQNVHNFIFELGEYVFRHSFSFSTSEKVINELYSKIYSLKFLPERCPTFNEKYKVLTIEGKYRVFFTINKRKSEIIILKIFSSMQDYNNVI